MRKIDSDAFNKKIVAKIKELDFLVKNISPENVSYFDAELIEAAENYTKVIKDCTWESESNFNGIEMHKVQDILDNLAANKKNKYYVIRETHPEVFDGPSGEITFNCDIAVPPMFDGRKSIVFTNIFKQTFGGSIHTKFSPRFLLHSGGYYKVYKTAGTIDVRIRMNIEENRSLYSDVFVFMWR